MVVADMKFWEALARPDVHRRMFRRPSEIIAILLILIAVFRICSTNFDEKRIFL
ncbi:hypothetical protein l13_19130 [Neisseria weaveri ATCC 51223]|nr:hypothetical protein l13_19130 [Neisseria weaveri ATCC 51223]